MKKIVLILGVVAFAFVVLFISIFNSSAVTYPVPSAQIKNQDGHIEEIIDYKLPYMGLVLPDSPFWKLKALRDKVWFAITGSHLRKAQLALLFADKRLAMARDLFQRGKPDVAVSTFTKGERYLVVATDEMKIARSQGDDVGEFLTQLATSALKHQEIAEELILSVSDEARPIIEQAETYSKDTYKVAEGALNELDLPVPKNPFDRD